MKIYQFFNFKLSEILNYIVKMGTYVWGEIFPLFYNENNLILSFQRKILPKVCFSTITVYSQEPVMFLLSCLLTSDSSLWSPFVIWPQSTYPVSFLTTHLQIALHRGIQCSNIFHTTFIQLTFPFHVLTLYCPSRAKAIFLLSFYLM